MTFVKAVLLSKLYVTNMAFIYLEGPCREPSLYTSVPFWLINQMLHFEPSQRWILCTKSPKTNTRTYSSSHMQFIKHYLHFLGSIAIMVAELIKLYKLVQHTSGTSKPMNSTWGVSNIWIIFERHLSLGCK